MSYKPHKLGTALYYALLIWIVGFIWGTVDDIIERLRAQSDPKALKTAYEIKEIDSRAARWIASDAIRELESEKVRERLTARG